ncbi:DUF3784 domain-containing protein [Algoriphagus sp.]|uniref:DUF3784 domain-containing protein n=1 Tax=Algoriphagus sp. TaxID=1872435 RepID=UPI00391A3B36
METLIKGTLFLIIGLTVRVFPNVLAGYSSLSQRERENAEKNGLQFYGFLLFSLMGVVTIIGYPVSIWLEKPELSSGILVIVTIVGIVVAVVGGNVLINNRIR